MNEKNGDANFAYPDYVQVLAEVNSVVRQPIMTYLTDSYLAVGIEHFCNLRCPAVMPVSLIFM